MFDFWKKKRAVDLTAPWEFGATELPVVVVGDAGSGKSELLLEIARQAMALHKTVFYITLKSDVSAFGRFAAAAVQAGIADKCFVGSYMLGPEQNEGIDMEPMVPVDVVRQQGAACVGFCALSLAEDEMRNLAGEVIGACLSAIGSDAAQDAAVLLVDDVEFLGPEILNGLKLLSGQAEVVLSMSGSFAARDDVLLVPGARVVSLNSVRSWWSRLEMDSVKPTGERARRGWAAEPLEPGRGYMLQWGRKTAEWVTWSMNPAPSLKQLKFANRRLESVMS